MARIPADLRARIAPVLAREIAALRAAEAEAQAEGRCAEADDRKSVAS